MTPLDLGNIPLGQRIGVDFVPDSAVDVKSDGNFVSVTVDSGAASAHVGTAADESSSYDSTATKSRVYFNGDGASLGLNSATVAMDGHVDSVPGTPGPVDVEITQVITWTTTAVDATTFTATPGPLEPIPTAPTPAALAAKKK